MCQLGRILSMFRAGSRRVPGWFYGTVRTFQFKMLVTHVDELHELAPPPQRPPEDIALLNKMWVTHINSQKERKRIILDRVSIVRPAISLRAKILYVPENLIGRVRIKRWDALVFDFFEPERLSMRRNIDSKRDVNVWSRCMCLCGLKNECGCQGRRCDSRTQDEDENSWKLHSLKRWQ